MEDNHIKLILFEKVNTGLRVNIYETISSMFGMMIDISESRDSWKSVTIEARESRNQSRHDP